VIRRIYNAGELYLTRIYLLRSKWLTLFLHIFHAPDPARGLHNHPWDWCFAWVLWGGYVELLEHDVAVRQAPGFRRFFGSTYHTIYRLLKTPTVTLFAHGKEVRVWSFLDEQNEAVPWHEYLVDRGLNTQEEIDAVRGRYKE
jgi:hypothetical protein